jgi:hypothetical protein
MTKTWPMKIIRIPRTPASAFDKNRPASELLKAQARHARAVEETLPTGRRRTAPPQAIETEHDAAEYVGRITRQLNPDAAEPWRLPRGERPPKSGVWLGPARVRTRPKGAPKHAARPKAAKSKAAGSRASAAKRRGTKKHARRR